MKKVIHIQRGDVPHWVGDGFPVRSIFTYQELAIPMSPFLLMDYAGPTVFPPNKEHVRGVGEHPHRGFETVTIVYAGEVEHRDSAGGGGLIRPGDVQWMTAAGGLVHEEKHGADFAKKGGAFEMVQLWVNLPKKDKMSSPRYQGIKQESIPQLNLPENAGTIRIIAGDYEGLKGPAKTFTPINLWDIRLKAGHTTSYRVPGGHTASLFLLDGEISVQGEVISSAELALLEPQGESFSITANKDSKLLFMGGEPIKEPLIGYGPFVMNSKEEIHQAFMDFQSGKMGQMNGNRKP